MLDIDEDASEPNRWRQLISITGAAMTLSSIGGELTGYFQFLSNANHTFDGAINKLIGIAIGGESYSSTTLWVVKTVLITTGVWALFFLALRRYAVAYENTTLDKWISEVRCFLSVKPEKNGRSRHHEMHLIRPVTASIAMERDYSTVVRNKTVRNTRHSN